jgi:hypothetical protein
VGKAKTVATTPKKEPKESVEAVKEVKDIVQTPIRPLLITKGMHLEYNGDYDAEQLSRIFTKLQLLTEGEENKFNLSISITERA